MLHNVRFHFYEILENAKLYWQKADEWLPGAEGDKKIYIVIVLAVLWLYSCTKTELHIKMGKFYYL